MLNVRRENLLIVAGIVWFLAGANVLALGIGALLQYDLLLTLSLTVAGLVVFALFGGMFHRIMAKNARRIWGIEESRVSLFRFFDARGYLTMVIMMALGYGLRDFGIAPGWFIAFFYTGLGAALCLAGASFLAARASSREAIAALHQKHQANQ